MPEANHVSWLYNVASLLWLQCVVLVTFVNIFIVIVVTVIVYLQFRRLLFASVIFWWMLQTQPSYLCSTIVRDVGTPVRHTLFYVMNRHWVDLCLDVQVVSSFVVTWCEDTVSAELRLVMCPTSVLGLFCEWILSIFLHLLSPNTPAVNVGFQYSPTVRSLATVWKLLIHLDSLRPH